MKAVALIVAAIVPYLIAGVNPSILLSKLVYRQDIRTQGSKNPGFTNFKRVYGWKLAWLVFILDLAKGAVACLVAGYLFRAAWSDFHLGAAYGALFAMLGHAYPVWYGFKGGKTVTVWLCSIWFIDWRAGLVAVGVFLVLLFTVQIMSVASMSASVAFAAALGLFEGLLDGGLRLPVLLLSLAAAALLIWRHHANIDRLIHGTENRFRLFGKTKKTAERS